MCNPRVEFLKMGFTCRYALLNVCKSIDARIDQAELFMWWFLGVCSKDFENRMDNIIEQLKSE